MAARQASDAAGRSVPPGRGGPGHQFVLTVTPAWEIEVSCTCQRAGRMGAGPIAARRRWGPGEAHRVWLAHLREAGIAVPDRVIGEAA